MNASEFAAARQTLGESVENLAVSLDLTPKIVVAFENGSVAIPKDTADEMTWRVATFERRAALATSGLPECSWVDSWQAGPMPSRSADRVKRLTALTEHLKECPTCMAREKFVLDRFGPMPARPVTGWMGWLFAIMKQIDRLPAWMRPGASFALAFLAYSAFKTALMLPRLRQTERPWFFLLEAFALSGSIGFAVGSIYGGVKWLLKLRAKPGTAAT